MNLFSKKEVILLRELVNKENQEYYKKQNTKYDSDLHKRNKDINNAYKNKIDTKVVAYIY